MRHAGFARVFKVDRVQEVWKNSTQKINLEQSLRSLIESQFEILSTIIGAWSDKKNHELVYFECFVFCSSIIIAILKYSEIQICETNHIIYNRINMKSQQYINIFI